MTSVELSAALNNPMHTYAALGGYQMNGCHLVIFNRFLHLIGGVRVVPLIPTAAARGACQVLGQGSICGFGGGFSLAIDMAAEVGLNPLGFGGHLGISGSAWIEVFGERIGLGVGLVTDFQIAEPKIFTLDVVFTLDLCWPLDDLHFNAEIFALDDRRPATPLAPLKFGPSDPLSWFHGPSGNMGTLTANDTKLWPDVIISVDFQRQAGQSGIIVNPSSGVHDEANVKVQHDFSEVKIEKLDPSSGTYKSIDNVRASWLLSANGDRCETTNRLAIPCTDPLGWLNRFDYAQPSTIEPIDRPRFQTFGAGPSQFFDVQNGGGNAVATFEEVDIESRLAFRLIPVPWSDSYDRALVSRGMEIGFSKKLASGIQLIATSACELRILGSFDTHPQIGIKGGAAGQPHRIRRIGRDRAEWSIPITRSSVEIRSKLTLNAEQAIQLVAIGYSQTVEILNPVPDLTVLQQGFYQLTIKGVSRAHYRGNPAQKEPTWEIVQPFEIVPPPTRPYMRYSTLGDERLFGLDVRGWNPNPRGNGFGHYQGHHGLIRARVGYLSQIYQNLWIATKEGATPERVAITLCEEGTAVGGKASQDWKVATGLPVPIEEELVFKVPPDVGTHRLLIFRSLLGDGTDLKIIDDWLYRVSRHTSPVDHLTPSFDGLNRAFGPFGSRTVPRNVPPPLPGAFDFDIVPDSKLKRGSALPPFLKAFGNLQDPQAGLCFLRILDWCGIFNADPSPVDEGPMFRPEDPDLCVVFDSAKAPLGLLVRTSEPCDWRRVNITLVVGTFDANGERLETQLIPSPDGCSCLILAIVEGVPVRLPRTNIAMRLRFRLQFDGLPRLTVVGDIGRKVEEIRMTFVQPFGDAW